MSWKDDQMLKVSRWRGTMGHEAGCGRLGDKDRRAIRANELAHDVQKRRTRGSSKGDIGQPSIVKMEGCGARGFLNSSHPRTLEYGRCRKGKKARDRLKIKERTEGPWTAWRKA